MGGLSRGMRALLQRGLASTIALGLLATGSFARAAPADEEPEFLSTGTSVSSPPLSPAPAAPAARDGATVCPPGSKNEICRCIVYDPAGKQGPRYYPAAGKLPPYCADPRLKAAIELDEFKYLDLLFRIQQENGIIAHDG